ncbi:AraC family transcriptional regulator ligand-binding domain-containing protein [Frankia sp. CNm7]|uniref:AraC family transcriptional regulator ligand-binding domain-containing protein n=1 Tax=Frankia nepalensis TaxID=1836974 RepID=A0A937UT85_9ACTN|nr:AraC family transcriptional regulator [Frankia nepalensis]MBL7498792.1 AraC family transcriptional regulator ligand-binding domain-containing protein [Frankia nepalensis]MBL7508597.1 AraC family transcriptional regulator ligand-binding domain-containing protein [Frankia nepalensis]MBL7517485.1 AraC family transcriptional regulator ligand-binding domain-containing protein [Frankia nepalensis]MBL7629731.1 AraC family transcriptional regulator ligand-binding domain-containing protein [Frankia n
MTLGRFSLDPGIKVFVTDLRLSWPRVLRRAALPGDLLIRRPAMLTVAEYYRFWSALAEEGGDRDLALDVGQAISVETFSPPIMAALCSPTLTVAAQRIATYKPLVGPLRLEVTETATGLQISYRWPPGQRPPTLLATSEVVFWVALARIATRHHIRPTGVTLSVAPSGPTSLESYLGTRVSVGDTDAVTFTAADAARPFLTENEPMWRFFAPELRRRLADLHTEASVADRVRAALHETLPAGDPSITAVTRRLAISSRTLQRQLRDEGTTYQDVLAGTRESLARHYLHQGNLRTGEIAYLLGYQDTNSFYRAFRTWTGITPETARGISGEARVGGLTPG